MAVKLSEIRGDRCIDVVADLIVPVSRLAKDPNVKQAFAAKKPPKGVTAQDFFVERMGEVLPSLLKDHKEDFIEIMATLEGVTPAEYAENLNLAKLFQDVVSLLTDNAFTDFLA